MKLDRLQSFVTLVDRGSFELAADELDLTKAVVASHVAKLESELGVTLLIPSAKAVAVTDAGYRFYESCSHLVKLGQAAVEEARAEDAALTGILRVTSTAEYGAYFLAPILAELGERNPKLKIQLSASANMDDLAVERCDVAIYTDRMRSSSDRAALLGRFRVLAVAAPSYLAQRPEPKNPRDLRKLDWIAHSGFETPYTWVSTGSRHKVALDAQMQADTAMSVLAFVRAGRGVAILPDWLVADSVADGSVVALLPEFKLTEHGVFAVYPNEGHIPGKVRQFVDLLRATVRDE